MKIKKGDKVLVITGKNSYEKNRKNDKVVCTGTVLTCLPAKNKIVVEGINTVVKHVKPRKAGEAGGRITKEAAFDASNAMVICPKCDKATRVGIKTTADKDGKAVRVRVCKKCGAELDK